MRPGSGQRPVGTSSSPELHEPLSSAPAPADCRSSSCRDMAAAKAEKLFSESLACVAAPLSPLDGYSKLEELQMLLRNAAAGGSLLAAEAAGLLNGECAELGGEGRVCRALQDRSFQRCLETLLWSVLMQNAVVFLLLR